MAGTRILRVALLSALGLLCSCGLGGAQNRPEFVSSFPAEGQTLTSPLQEIRLTYDEPVSILNPSDVRVFTRFGGFVETTVTQRAGDPTSIYVRPTTQPTFPVDDDVIVQVAEGAVQNVLSHYAEDQYEVAFTAGLDTPLLIGEPGSVSLIDSETFALIETLATPAGSTPVGIVSTIRDTTQRVWVQLGDGSGVGESIAWFEPGDLVMGTISLTSVADLTATAGAITVGPEGRYVYAAFRDTDSGGVRLVRVATDTATEDAFLDLTAIASGAGTEAVDLRWSEDGTQLIVAAATGPSAGTLAFVDREAFTEVDTNDVLVDVQGFALPNGAGPFVAANNRFFVARPGTNDIDILSDTGSVTASSGTVSGTISAMLLTPDRQFIVEGLAGYLGNQGFQTRASPTGYTSTEPADVHDDVAGVDLASNTVLDLKPLQGTSRFVALLGTAGGRLLAFFEYAPHFLLQEDLDDVTADEQVADIDALVPAATVVGRTYGAFAP